MQEDLFSGWEQVKEGAGRAADHAGEEWKERAFFLFIEFAKNKESFTAEDAVEYAEGKGLSVPPDKRAWGHVVNRARQGGFIKKIGYGNYRNPKSHSGINTIWKGIV